MSNHPKFNNSFFKVKCFYSGVYIESEVLTFLKTD